MHERDVAAAQPDLAPLPPAATDLSPLASQALLRSSSVDQRAAAALALQRRAGNAATVKAIGAPRRMLSRFDPKWHRNALLTGLRNTTGFTSGDLGAIYAGNWERDFSQAHPALGAVVLAWKELQLAKAEGRPLAGPAATFRSAMSRLGRELPSIASGEAYGGYRYYEHMDNPVVSSVAASERTRLMALEPEGIPRYIADSRDEAILQIVDAVSLNGVNVDPSSRAWRERMAWEAARARTFGVIPVSGGPTASERVPDEGRAAANEAEAQSRRLRGESSTRTGPGLPRTVTERLGRASHIIEDYFAHSNFVEMAMGIPGFGTALQTGTFGANDKAHALSNKLQALYATLRSDPDLMDRALGIRPLEGDNPWYAVPGQWELQLGLRSLLGNIRLIAEALEHGTHAIESEGSHTHLAKDQPGEGNSYSERLKTVRFQAAQVCAAAADQAILGRLPPILSSRDAGPALDAVVDTVHRVITPPTPSHPFWAALGPYRTSARALMDEENARVEREAERLQRLDRFGPRF